MNIIVKTASGQFITRPDTTWEKDNEDFYPPEFISELSFSPILFVRVSKPGRSVSRKFADRYYDGVNYGVLLYPEDLLDGSETAFSTASMVDHTSFLPFPLYGKAVLDNPDNAFSLSKTIEGKESEEIFSHSGASHEMIAEAIESATKLIYIRTGDVIAIELEPRKPLVKREDKSVQVDGTFCSNNLVDFKIIF